MPIPIDFTDPQLLKAYSHPLRVQILALLDNRVASPNEIATELGAPLGNTSYHVRRLVALGLVELVRRQQRRGAIEHYYTAKVRPAITDAWAKLPDIIKRAVIGGSIQQGLGYVVTAAEQGGFDRDDIHYSRTEGSLDAKGWKAAAREMAACLKRIERIFDESNARVTDDSNAEAEHSTVLLMHFIGPTPGSTPADHVNANASLRFVATQVANGRSSR